MHAEGLLLEQLMQPGSHTPTTELSLMVTMVLPVLSVSVRQVLLVSQLEQNEGQELQVLLLSR